MGRIGTIALILSSAALFACAGHGPYGTSMSEGTTALNTGDYARARQDFQKAAQVRPDAQAYAFAATASYKLHDLQAAQRSIDEAARLDGSSPYVLRTLGYKALTLLAQGKKREGLDALHEYLGAYRNADPLMTIREVERMRRTGNVDLPLLEKLLDEQITTYENDIAEFRSTGNGWYGQRYLPPASGGEMQ